MHALIIRCALLAWGAGLWGCGLQGEGPAKRLHDTVQDMNKSTRWGQLADAAQWVDGSFRGRFVQNHAQWGSKIQVADSEVMRVEMAPDQETAVAIVSYEWYLLEAMTLHTTVVQQRWSQFDQTFMLVSESVVQGDARLFAAPPPTASPASTAADDAVSLAPPM